MTEHILSTKIVSLHGLIIDLDEETSIPNVISVTMQMRSTTDLLPMKECVRNTLSVFSTKDTNIYLRDSKDMYDIDDEGNFCVRLLLQIVEQDYEKIVEKLRRFIARKYHMDLKISLYKLIVPHGNTKSNRISRFIWDLYGFDKMNVANLESLLPVAHANALAVCEDGLHEAYNHMSDKINAVSYEINEHIEILTKANKVRMTLEELQESKIIVDRLNGEIQSAHESYEKDKSMKMFNTALINIKNEMDIFFSKYNK